MKYVDLQYAIDNLSELVDEAAAGEVITILRDGEPRAKLVRLDDGAAAAPST